MQDLGKIFKKLPKIAKYLIIAKNDITFNVIFLMFYMFSRSLHGYFHSSDEMKSIFNRLLASLVLSDNAYLFLTLVETLRRTLHLDGYFHFVYAYFLYPIRSLSLVTNVYLAVALAVERYRAIK